MGLVGIPPVRHTIGPRLGRVHLDDLWSSGDQALEGGLSRQWPFHSGRESLRALIGSGDNRPDDCSFPHPMTRRTLSFRPHTCRQRRLPRHRIRHTP
jgi:hypothetical protein